MDTHLRGWLLHRKPTTGLSSESYERNRLVAVGRAVGIELKIVTPEQIDLVVTGTDRKSVLLKSKVVDLPDFIIPRMGSETTYFALAVIRHLERLGVRSFNGSAAIEVVRDKLYTQQILAASDLPIAKTMLAKFPVNVRRVRQLIGFPVVVKTLSGQQGKGVSLCESEAALEDMMNLIAATDKNANIILQEFIPDSYGRDVRVMVIGGRVVAAMERRAKPGTFKSNLSRGGKGHPTTVTTASVRQTPLRGSRASRLAPRSTSRRAFSPMSRSVSAT
jgi:gamma-F420-2:alpha-L-glutamate ligase